MHKAIERAWPGSVTRAHRTLINQRRWGMDVGKEGYRGVCERSMPRNVSRRYRPVYKTYRVCRYVAEKAMHRVRYAQLPRTYASVGRTRRGTTSLMNPRTFSKAFSSGRLVDMLSTDNMTQENRSWGG